MRRAIITAAAALLVLIPSAAGSTAPALEAESSFSSCRWWYGTYLGGDRVEQSYLPIDLLWRPREDTGVRLGGELAWSARKGFAGDDRLDGPGDIRVSAETALHGGRVRVAAGGATAMRSRSLRSGEIHVAEALDALALEMPLARPAHGGKWGVQAAGLLVRTPFLLLQGGAGVEVRLPYVFEDSGREVEPGAVLRLGAGMATGRGSSLHSLDANLDMPGSSTLQGGGEYLPGSQVRLTWLSSAGSGRSRFRASAGFVARAGGSVGRETPLDASAVRGGNLLRLGVAGSRRMGSWEMEAGLAGTWVRGFPGALGSASWVEPSLAVSIPFASGVAAIGLRLITGQCREERHLRGAGFSLGWKGALVQ